MYQSGGTAGVAITRLHIARSHTTFIIARMVTSHGLMRPPVIARGGEQFFIDMARSDFVLVLIERVTDAGRSVEKLPYSLRTSHRHGRATWR
jgi:hypothetical protein